jgi:TolA-binding protein
MMMRAATCTLAVLLLAGCATVPEEDPVQLRLDDLDARVGRVDRVVDNGLVQLSQQLEAQQRELRELRGRIEELQNDNAKLRQEQRNLYADLEQRISQLRSTRAAAPMAAADPADEQAQYDRALEALRNRDYAAAVDGLRRLAAT